MKRRIISLLTVITMLLSFFPVISLAATSGTSGDITWMLDDNGTLTVDGNGAITSEPWSSYKNDITNIIIGDEITSIGKYCFQVYTNVKTITIGKNVKSFGGDSYSFGNIPNLETVYWNATAADDLLFGGEYYTSFLQFSGSNVGGTNIVFGEGVEVIPNCFSRATINKMIIPSSVKTISLSSFNAKEVHISDLSAWCNINFSNGNDYLFAYTKLYNDGNALTDLVIPDSTTKISDYAFCNIKDITSITIPDSVTEIGNYAFYKCNGITELNIGDGVTSIGDYAFYECKGITELNLGNSVTSIGNNAFYGCSGFTSIELPQSTTTIGRGAFEYCSSLASIRFSENVTTIGSNAFYRCASPFKIYYGGGLYDWEDINGSNSVPNATIYYYYTDLIKDYGECGDNLKWVLTDGGTLTISGTGDMYGYTNPYKSTPWGKEGVKHLIIQDGVTSIGGKAFFDCYDLESVVISDTVKTIGYQAFDSCTALSELTIGKGVTELGDSAFSYCESLKTVTIPGSVQTMTHNAFSYCDKLETVVIEEGVPYIYNDAFTYCTSLKEITIPVSVKSIGTAAFGYCNALSRVNYAGTDVDWNNITIASGNNSLITAYENSVSYEGDGKCGENLEWALENGVLTISGTGDMYDFDISDAALPWYELGDSVTSIVIKEGVTGIGAYTFWLCFNLKTVTIPSSVKEIRTYAFGNCDKLTKVYYLGSKSAYNSIIFANLNPYIKDAKTYYLKHKLNIDLDENKIYIKSDKIADDTLVLVALYDKYNDFIGTKHVKADIADGITSITSPIDDYSGAATIKLMGWNGFTNMAPVFDATAITNE